MKNSFAGIILLFFSITVSAQEKILTLKECIKVAIENNILVKQAGLQADVAAINLQQ
ncbi:MAG: TolC family protein, partial [Gloeobacteraceae cyanobacterium ES-bin-316]|nr:TolC family protein [Ferruginibacter sp.]